jgi:hypothetical protein
VPTQTEESINNTQRNQLLWLAGAVGTAAGVAVWAYSRNQPTYWERTKRRVGQFAETASNNPWRGIGAGAVALGSVVLVRRARAPKGAWRQANQRADEWILQARETLRPWWGVIAGTAISAASAAYRAKTPKRARNAVVNQAAEAADRLVDSGARIWQRMQKVSREAGKMYPSARKLLA